MATDKGLVEAAPQRGALVTVVPSRENLAIVREALGQGESLSIDLLRRAKIIAGGVTAFDLGDGETAKDLTGVLILRQPTRVYWKARYGAGEGGSPPDCSSLDNAVGRGNRMLDGIAEDENSLHDCQTCPLADWGTAVNEKGETTGGKACRQVTRAFMLAEGDVLPTLVSLPPSSYKAALTHTVRVASTGTPYYGVVTKVSLVKEQGKSGPDFSRAVFAVDRKLTPEEFAAVQGYRDAMLPFLNALSVVDVEARDSGLD